MRRDLEKPKYTSLAEIHIENAEIHLKIVQMNLKWIENVGYRTPVFIQRFPGRLHITITYNLPHLRL
jgi:hypothetical protein